MKSRSTGTPVPVQLKRAIRERLIPWFAENKRDMPWRKNRTPYRVWISELMLQQTRVDQATDYFHRFMRRFPSVRKLADAPLNDVLKAWEGLGYYARARNAHRTARHVTTQLRGRFPSDYNGLLALPGVGPYTAAAIASLAYNQDHAVLDGNVIRVLSRLVRYEKDARTGAAKADLQQVADALLVKGRAAEFNEALMELGALICTPRSPQCAICPLQNVCEAAKAGLAEDYPRRTPKAKVPHKEVGAAVVVNRKGDVLIAQRNPDAMLGGLWEFPGGTCEPDETMPTCVARELKEELGIDIAVGDRLMIVRHAYSHFTIALHVYWARIKRGRPRPIQCAAVKWSHIKHLRDHPFSRADLQIIEKLQQLPIQEIGVPQNEV